MSDLLIILAAAFGAGALNAIAGGGTFLTFPALVFIGVPPIIANATSAVAVFPGYLAAAAGFRRDIGAVAPVNLYRAIAAALAGGLAGGLLLLVSNDAVFSAIVPFLLLAATLVFAFQDRLRRALANGALQARPYGGAGLFLVSLYGGYFNGGLGIVMLALFALWGLENINLMNGLKNILSFVVSAISVATFALAGIVLWQEAVVMMIAAVAGGYAGARLARLLPARVVRIIVIAIGFGMSVIFFARM